jgi:hypothetical protein
MEPVTTAALITGGSALIGGGVNAAVQGNLNKKSRQFAREMYGRQVDDNIRFWNMQNQYNTPTQQVSRLEAAGLNKALMYGGSASGASGLAGGLSAPTAQTPQFKSSNPGDAINQAGLSFINSIYDLQLKEQQLDNLKEQKAVLSQDATYRAAQTSNLLAGTTGQRIENEFARQNFTNSLEAARETTRQIRTKTDIELNREQRAAALHAPTVAQALVNIQKTLLENVKSKAEADRIRADIRRINADTDLKRLDYKLQNELGITSGSPYWVKMIGLLAKPYLDGKKDLSSQIEKMESSIPQLGKTLFDNFTLPGRVYQWWNKK